MKSGRIFQQKIMPTEAYRHLLPLCNLSGNATGHPEDARPISPIRSSSNIPISAANGAAELPSPSGAVAGGAFDGECRGDSSGGENGDGCDKCDFHFVFYGCGPIIGHSARRANRAEWEGKFISLRSGEAFFPHAASSALEGLYLSWAVTHSLRSMSFLTPR
jgi:hypothetical protein